MIGKIFGFLKVIEQIDKRYYKCQCVCSSYKRIRIDHLINNPNINCGCKSKEKIRFNKIGKRFNRLVIIDLLSGRKCKCKCDCGNETIVFENNLERGNTTSCGCVFKEVISIKTKLNSFYPDEYRSWSMMKNRCLNPNAQNMKYYKDVAICEEWVNSFEIFLKDMGERPYPKKEYSIDRINNELGYFPTNCRWSSKKDQSNNRRNRNTVL